MVHTDPAIPMLIRPYQISYKCPAVQPAREYIKRYSKLENPNIVRAAETIRYAEVSMGIQQKTISNAFLSLLRFYGWEAILLLHEVSSLSAPLIWLADMISLSFEAKSRVGSSPCIVASRTIHSDSDYYNLLLPWADNIDGKSIMLLNKALIQLYC
nr:hypothetical transcript [Hymenolepis microstoma]